MILLSVNCHSVTLASAAPLLSLSSHYINSLLSLSLPFSLSHLIGAIIIGKVSVIESKQTEVFELIPRFFSPHSEDDENDLIARKAFEALLRVSLLQPTSPKFNQFADEVRERAKRDYDYSFYEGEEVSEGAYAHILLMRSASIAGQLLHRGILRWRFTAGNGKWILWTKVHLN
jgi:hypothetical protein